MTALEPRARASIDRVTAIAAGGNHTMVLTVGGAILGFGRNHKGQLGLGHARNVWVPEAVQIPSTSSQDSRRAVQVACGLDHSLALVLFNGGKDVFVTGENQYGQLGLGPGAQRRVLSFTRVPGLSGGRVVCVMAGESHSAAVGYSGELFLWGRNDVGQLGLGDDLGR